MSANMHMGGLDPEWQSAIKPQSEQVRTLAASPTPPWKTLHLAAKRHAILNFSLIVPPTLGRNEFAPRKARNQMYPLVEG
jgi:hypothetical protein